MNNTARTLFGRGRQPRHRTEMGATAVECAATMHPVVKVAVLLGVRVPSAVDKAAVRAGACSILCD